MSDVRIVLNAAANRQVLGLAESQRLAERTAARLATGLAVIDAADDAPSFFAARGLSETAEALLEINRDIEAAIGLLSTALIAAQAINRLLRQMDGLLSTAVAKYDTYLDALRLGSADQADIARGDQWDGLIDQIGALADDASFEGRNLVGDADPAAYSWRPSAITLKVGLNAASVFRLPAQYLGNVYVSEENGVNLRLLQGDGISARGGVVHPTETGRFEDFDPAQTVFADGGATYVTTPNVPESRPVIRLGTPISGVPNPAPGAGFGPLPLPGANIYLRVIKPNGYLSEDTQYQTVNVVTPGDPSSVIEPVLVEAVHRTPIIGLGLMTSGMYEGFVTRTGIDGAQAQLDRAKDIARGAEAQFGAAIAFLRKRLEFNRAKALTSQDGAAKLTAANLNVEGARLVAIQVRRQLGIGALAESGRREAAILSLFQPLDAR